jgi:hypothetical protein
VLIVIPVAVIQERSRHLAAIIATMPVTAPLAMWIVFSASRGDQRQTADFVGSRVMFRFELGLRLGVLVRPSAKSGRVELRHEGPDRDPDIGGQTW